MPDLTHRSSEKELLDASDIPEADVILNMKELDTINTLLGGHRITLSGFKSLAGNKKNISVMEIGCGGGDNLRVIEEYCGQKGITLSMHGVDMNADICRYASTKNPRISMQCCDYRLACMEVKPDVIFSSLFCHHFTEDELNEQLNWMKTNSRIGFFINDLHRHHMAYHAIKYLTSFFSSSYLVKHDAPLSVARGFKKKEWHSVFTKAGIQHYQIVWKWAFRYLIIFRHGK